MTGSSGQPDAPSDAGQRGGYGLSFLLAALAGGVDAIGFVRWHGLFVSFMSGNSTTLGATLAGADWRTAAVSASVIAGFVAGVTAGELLSDAVGANARAIVLLVVAVLLGAGAVAVMLGVVELVAAPLLSVAMGIQNASVHRAGGISVALTYVTGTLVHVGRGIAKALRAAGPWSAVPPYLGLWVGFLSGAIAGGAAALRSDVVALAGAAAVALLLAAFAYATAGRGERSRSAAVGS